jgi:DNA-binding MarR family transcriptional regulator
MDTWARLLRGHSALRRSVSAQLQGDHGLSVSDYETLLLLARAEERSMRRVDIADQLQLTPSGVTRMLDKLEKAQLVEKATCSSDARVTYAVITEAGTRKLEEASGSHLAVIEALFQERYTPEELETLAELLGRLPGAGSADGEDCSAPGPEE